MTRPKPVGNPKPINHTATVTAKQTPKMTTNQKVRPGSRRESRLTDPGSARTGAVMVSVWATLACPSVRKDTPRRAASERLADLLLGVTVAGNELAAAAR